MSYYNARYYDPRIARFVTADSVIDGVDTPSGWNGYCYVKGNPVIYKDPTGNDTVKQGVYVPEGRGDSLIGYKYTTTTNGNTSRQYRWNNGQQPDANQTIFLGKPEKVGAEELRQLTQQNTTARANGNRTNTRRQTGNNNIVNSEENNSNTTEWTPNAIKNRVLPNGTVTSGYRVPGSTRPNHNGIDIAAPAGTPIRSIADGVVERVRERGGGYGRHVFIKHRLRDGTNVVTLYAHNSSNSVRVGQRVRRRQQIGTVGNTGSSDGNHVHFEVRPGRTWATNQRINPSSVNWTNVVRNRERDR